MKTKTFFKWLCCSAILLMASVQPAWATTYTFYYQKDMPSDWWEANQNKTMTQSSAYNKRYYCTISLDANSSYGIYVKEDNTFYKNSTTAESNQKVQLYKYDQNNSNRVTFKSGNSGTYIFTYDADTKELFVSPQSSQTIVMYYVNTGGGSTYDSYYCLDNSLSLTQEGTSAKYSGIVNLTSAKKHYMYVKIGSDLYWRGKTTLSVGSSTQLYFYKKGGTCGDSGDKINFTPSSSGKYKFTWNHLDKTMKMERVYTITYNLNGGSGASAPTAQDVVSGNNVTLADKPSGLTKTGYDFAGWNTKADGTGTNTYNPGATIGPITSDWTMYAKWTPQVYDITYEDQGGSDFSGDNAGDLPSTHTYGTATALVDASRAGYKFDGWFESSDCTGSAITEIGATAKTADFTLYAKWTEDKVYYDVTSGVKSFAGTTEQQTSKADLSISATSGEYNSSTNKVLASSILKFTVSNIATGYEIEGWYSDETCTSEIDGAGTSSEYSTPAVAGPVNVYVKILATQYNITYKNVYGTNPNPSSYNVEDEFNFQSITEYRTGYTFTGWNPTGIAKGSTGAKTTSAQWTAKTYTISFNQNGGTGGQGGTVTATYDQAMPALENFTAPVKNGYKFLGYYYNNVQYYTATGSSARTWNVDDNVTLTAKWDQIHVYIEGRFKVRTSEGGAWKYTGATDGAYVSDGSSTKNIEIPFVEAENKYRLNTYLYVNEAAASIGTELYVLHIATWTQNGGFTQLKADCDGTNFYFNAEHQSATLTTNSSGKNFWFSETTNFGGPIILTYDPVANKLSYTAEPEPTFGINFKSGGHGHLNVSDGIHNVGVRSGYNITAYPDAGYKFEKWTSTGGVVITDANNASTSITVTGVGTVTANFVEMKKIYFRKPSDWPKNQVFVYFYTTDKLQWNTTQVCGAEGGAESKNLTGFEMSRIGKTDIYYYAYDFTAHAAVAFVNDRQDNYGAFDNTYVTALENFNPCYPLFNAENYATAYYNKHDCNTENYKECKYYGRGSWTSYDETEYYLRGSFNDWAGPRDEYRFKPTTDPNVFEAIWECTSENQAISFKLWQTCDCWLGKTSASYSGDVENIQLSYGSGDSYNISYTAPKVGRYQFKYNVSSQKLSITYMGYIMVQNFPEEVSVITGRQYKITPTVTLRDGMTLDDLAITVTGASHAQFTQSGTNLIVLGNTEGTDDVTVTYRNTQNDYSVVKTLKVNVATGITLQAQLTDDEKSWTKTDLVHVHFWSTDGDKAQDASMTYNSESDIYSVTIPKIVDGDGNINFLFWYGENINMLGSDNAKWRQTANMKTKVEMCYTIGYNSADNQYRVATPGTGLCESGAYQIEVSMRNGNTYLSNIVTTESESKTFSFFAPKDNDVTYKGGTVRLLMDGGVVKELTGFSQAGVYVADLNGDDITTPALYEGDYYVIAGVSGSELNDDTKMHKFTPRANTAEDYSYYWTVYSGNCTDKNVIAKVANKYNSNLSLTIGADALTQADGKVEAGNVRFSYEPTTNAFKRAILGASNSNDFLNVYGNNVYADAAATQPLTEDQSLDLSKFTDNSDWVYEKVVYVKVESAGSESKVTLKSVFNGQTSHLLGYEIDETTGEEKKDQPKQLTVLGTGSTPNNTPYQIRISYDFKKNRLISSWEPAEGIYSEDMAINSDVFFIRTEDGDVQQVQVGIKDGGTESYKISSLQHVMFVMEIDGSLDKTSYSQYWISLPFDCQISDIFGVEGYITLDENRVAQKGTWGIMRYRGDIRAQKGWFKETDGFWEWMYENETMYAGEGYVLFFERSSITSWPTIKDKGGNTKALKRLYFPSAQAGFVMSNTVTEENSKFTCESMRCTIKTPEDREAYDSNWRVIGPKSYNNIKAQAVVDDNPYGEQTKFPNFLYTYNVNAASGHKYEPHDGKEYSYQSFHAYMVQYEGTITWIPYTQTTPPATVAAHYVEDSNFKGGTLTIELMQNNEQLDRAFIKLDEKGTVGYDFSQDLTKITENCAQIASVSEDVLYAGNTLPLDIELVPLNVKVVANGTYDIALAQSLEGLEVRLYDAFEQTTTPLDLMSATVTLDKGEYKDRFFLQFVQKSPLSPTSFDGALEQINLPSDKTQKLLINDQIYLINAGRIYNVLGVGE